MAEQAGTSLDAMASLLKLFTGDKQTKTTSGGGFTDTTETNIDQTTLQALLKSALEGNQGLAAVTQGQKFAGLYNSSTNKLMANDLLARLTAKTAAEGASKATTRSAAPQTVTSQNAGGNLMAKGLLALTAAQKLGLVDGNKIGAKIKSTGSDVLDKILNAGSSAPTAFNEAGPANLSEAIAPIESPIQSMVSGNNDILAQLALGGNSFVAQPDLYSTISDTSYVGDQAWQDTSGPTAIQDQPVEPVITDQAATEDTTNFPVASSTASETGGTQTSSEILGEAAKTTLSNTQLLSGAGASAMGLYSGITALTDGNSSNDAMGAISTASGVYGAYNTYQAYQAAQAAKAAADAAAAASAASDASSAADAASAADGASAGGGSALGYIGPVISAMYAPNNPDGVGGKDYRHAVGSAVLNYFGFGWAAPIVHEVAQPVLDETMGNAEEVNGVQGAFMADPVGMPISGRYDINDVATSNLDPANLFGGNPGGSVGGLVGQAADPLGTLIFGNDSAGGAIADLINSDPVTSFVQDLGNGCFLTTACMQVLMEEFRDDCHELETLRKLRDEYISKLPDGPALLQEYYRTAPEMVTRINSLPNANAIWHELYNNHILPAVSFMDAGNPKSAYGIYHNMVSWLMGIRESKGNSNGD